MDRKPATWAVYQRKYCLALTLSVRTGGTKIAWLISARNLPHFFTSHAYILLGTVARKPCKAVLTKSSVQTRAGLTLVDFFFTSEIHKNEVN